MKRIHCLSFALVGGLPLLAQTSGLTLAKGDSSVTLYGVLDVGLARVQHAQDFSSELTTGVVPFINKNAPNSATSGVVNGAATLSHWGVRGQLALTGGWKAVFNLSGAINLPNGTIASGSLQYNKATGPQSSSDNSLAGSSLFGRGASVGLSHDTYGTLTLGRHTSLMFDAIPAWDALQAAPMFTPIGFAGSYGGGGATDNARVDSSVKYRCKLGKFTVDGLHKFGAVSGSSTARTVTEFMLGYEAGGFGTFVAYQRAIDMTSLANPAGTVNGAILSASAATLATTANGTVAYEPIGTLTATFFNTQATMAGVRYQTGKLLVCAAVEKEAFTNPSNPAHDANYTSIYSVPIGTWVWGGSIIPAINVSPYTIGGRGAEKDLTVYWGGARWQFTPKFFAAVGYYHVKQNDFSNGTTIAADKEGTQTYTSMMVDYAWTKAFDCYLGYMGSTGTGGMVASYLNTSNASMGVGMRYKF